MAAFTLAQIKAEMDTDPTGRGYAAPVAARNYLAIRDLINATYAGVGTVWRTNLTGAEVLGALVWAEVSALPTNSWLALQTLLIPATIDASNVRIRQFFAGLFPSATFSQSLANLTTVARHAAPSRAEELWGFGAQVSEQHIADALEIR